MSTKNQSRLFGLIAGLAGAACVHHWPSHAFYIQIAFYSVIVLGLLFWVLWSHRNQPGFWPGMSLVFLLHWIFLYLIRSIFPFKAMFTVAPLMLIEAIAGIILVLRILESKERSFHP
jgi:hypothetical protein